jgi:hypothetical protein
LLHAFHSAQMCHLIPNDTYAFGFVFLRGGCGNSQKLGQVTDFCLFLANSMSTVECVNRGPYSSVFIELTCFIPFDGVINAHNR